MPPRFRSALGTRRHVLGLALVAGVVLTACGQAQPGVAASIDGDSLSVTEVQERTAAFTEAYPDIANQVTIDRITAVTIQNFLRGHVADSIARELGLEPTEGELDEFVEQIGGIEEATRQVGQGGVPPDPELVAAEIRSAWIVNALRELNLEEVTDPEEADAATRATVDGYSAAADVSVNPRFGTWDGVIVTPANGSLSTVPDDPDALTGAGAIQVPPG